MIRIQLWWNCQICLDSLFWYKIRNFVSQQVPLARFLMMYTENDTTTFHLLAPQKGIYLLDIFAATYPSMDMCTKKEATKYINVCRFKVDCPDIDMVNALINVNFLIWLKDIKNDPRCIKSLRIFSLT